MRKLTTFVHVHHDNGQTYVYGPEDTVPDWAAEKIANPDVWADDVAFAVDPADRDGTGSRNQQPPRAGEPPRGGQGSGLAQWSTYAQSLDIKLEEGMNRDDIIAAVDAHYAAAENPGGGQSE